MDTSKYFELIDFVNKITPLEIIEKAPVNDHTIPIHIVFNYDLVIGNNLIDYTVLPEKGQSIFLEKYDQHKTLVENYLTRNVINKIELKAYFHEINPNMKENFQNKYLSIKHNFINLVNTSFGGIFEEYQTNELNVLVAFRRKQAAGGSDKIKLLGRLRKIYKEGRKSYIVYNKEKITITEARKLEKAAKQTPSRRGSSYH